MSRKRNKPVRLTEEERESLKGLIARGRASSRHLTHARILLKAEARRTAASLLSRP